MSSPRFEDLAIDMSVEAWNSDDWKWDSRRMVASPRNATLSSEADAQGGRTPADAGTAPPCSAVTILSKFTSVEGDAKSNSASESSCSRPSNRRGKVVVPAKAESRSKSKNKSSMQLCQADECGKDLSDLTYYHRRNRICDVHIKACSYRYDGKEVRFCQRCGHGHPLDEFDGGKHSCRKQLERHNARRRRKSHQAIEKEIQSRPGSLELTTKKIRRACRSVDDEACEGRRDAISDPPSTVEGRSALEDTSPPLKSVEPVTSGINFRNEVASIKDEAVEDLAGWLTAQLNGPEARGENNDDALFLEDVDFPITHDLLSSDRDPFDTALTIMSPTNALNSSEKQGQETSITTMPSMTDQAMLSTVSIKLFGCTPAELPKDLSSQFRSWFEGRAAGIQGYLRPGCVHLTLEAFVEPRAHDENLRQACNVNDDRCHYPRKGGIKSIVERMVTSGERTWRENTCLVQCGSEIALIHEGRLKQMWDASAAFVNGRFMPFLVDVSNPVILLGRKEDLSFRLRGMNLMQDNFEIVCRFQGSYVPIARAKCSDCRCMAATKKCCKSDGSAGESDGWERRCCGCCSRKLVTKDSLLTPSQAKTDGDVVVQKSVMLQSVLIDLESLPDRTGVLHLDVIKGAYVSARDMRCLVVDDAEIKAELCSRDPRVLQHWIDALGIVFEWLGDKEKLKWRTVERVACRLLHLAVGSGLIQLSKRLFAILSDEIYTEAASLQQGDFAFQRQDGLELLSNANQACQRVCLQRVLDLGCKDGLNLLHRAVQSSSVAMVQLVLKWFKDAQSPPPIHEIGPNDLTPMHLAVLAPDPSVAAHLVLSLLSVCACDNSRRTIWDAYKTLKSGSPMDFARRAGRFALVEVFGDSGLSSKEEKQSRDVSSPDSVEGPSTPRLCKCSANCPCLTSKQRCVSRITVDDTATCGSINGYCSCCASLGTKDSNSAAKSFCCFSK